MSENAKTETPKSGIFNYVSKALKIASVPIGAVSGIWVGAVSLRNRVYDRLKRAGAFDSVKPEDINTSAPKVVEEVSKTGVPYISPSQKKSAHRIVQAVAERKAGKPLTAGLVDEVSHLNKLSVKEITEELKHYDRLDLLHRQWKFAHKSEKVQAVMDAITVGVVAIGAIFAISEVDKIKEIFSLKDKEQGAAKASRE